jgi:hypothetical protein
MLVDGPATAFGWRAAPRERTVPDLPWGATPLSGILISGTIAGRPKRYLARKEAITRLDMVPFRTLCSNSPGLARSGTGQDVPDALARETETGRETELPGVFPVFGVPEVRPGFEVPEPNASLSIADGPLFCCAALDKKRVKICWLVPASRIIHN